MKYIVINNADYQPNSAGEYVRAQGGYFWTYFYEGRDEYFNYYRRSVKFFSYTAPAVGDVLLQAAGGYILLDKHARKIAHDYLWN